MNNMLVGGTYTEGQRMAINATTGSLERIVDIHQGMDLTLQLVCTCMCIYNKKKKFARRNFAVQYRTAGAMMFFTSDLQGRPLLLQVPICKSRGQ